MRSLQRLVAPLFLLALVGVLIGCGGGSQPAPVANNDPSATVAPTRDQAKPDESVKEDAAIKKLAQAIAEGYPEQPKDSPDFAKPGLDSVVMGGAGNGEAIEKGLKNLKQNWGSLSPAGREQAAREITTRLPEKQRALAGEYFKALDERDGAKPVEPAPLSKSEVTSLGSSLKQPERLKRQQELLEAQRGDPKGAAPAGPVAAAPVVPAPVAPPPVPPAADSTTAESYNMYRENEYRSPLAAPMSTFSADVNTASYSNVRRYLTQGGLPPKDAVFLAEFINYFPYEYVKPKGNDPIAFNLELGPCPWNRKHHLVRVGVQAHQIDPKEMPARKLTFLIDTSGSMSDPNKLPLVKQSLELLIDQLTEKDTVGIVTYASNPGVALMPTNGKEKEVIRAAVNGLGAGGSTNGEGGLKAAYDLARNSYDEKAVNRVILCTDGDFNVGAFQQGELVRLIEDQRKSGVFLTVLGYGMGNLKDGTMKELANHGNGHHAYIDTLDEAKKVFVDQGGALVLVAKDVKFQVEFNPTRVQAYRLVGYENRLLKDEDFRNDAKDAGDMGSGHQITVIYEIVPQGVPIELPKVDASKYTTPAKPNPAAPDEWLTVKMRFKRPNSEKSNDADELAQALKGDAKVKDLSADFEFAAAAASFGMLLRDSEFKGGMTYAGVLEMAQGALGSDPGGHRKEFLNLVKQADDMTRAKPAAGAETPPSQ